MKKIKFILTAISYSIISYTVTTWLRFIKKQMTEYDKTLKKILKTMENEYAQTPLFEDLDYDDDLDNEIM